MTTYVTQTYDLHKALSAKLGLAVAIVKVSRITDYQYLVSTVENGKWVCESFEDGDATVYMKVYQVI